MCLFLTNLENFFRVRILLQSTVDFKSRQISIDQIDICTVILNFMKVIEILLHLQFVLSASRCCIYYSIKRSKANQALLYFWCCHRLKEHKYLLSLKFRSLINDLELCFCVYVSTLFQSVCLCVCLMMKTQIFFYVLFCFAAVWWGHDVLASRSIASNSLLLSY